MEKFKENVKKLYKKIKKIVSGIIKSIMPFIYFFLVSAVIWSITHYYGCFNEKSNDDTVCAYPASTTETVIYNQLHGLFLFQNGTDSVIRYFDTSTRSASYSGILNSGFQNGLFYINLPVTYIYAGTQTLRTEFEPTQSQGEEYDVHLSYAITFQHPDGNILTFREVSNNAHVHYSVGNGWFREWFSELEELHNIQPETIYRIDRFQLTVDCSENVQVTTDFNIRYFNSSDLYYNDFLLLQRTFESEYLEFLNVSVGDIGHQITDLNNNLLEVEILPDFTIGNLLLIGLTIPLVWAVLKFFLGG